MIICLIKPIFGLLFEWPLKTGFTVLKIIRETLILCLIHHFEADFLWQEIQPQNSEFRNNRVIFTHVNVNELPYRSVNIPVDLW